MFDKLPKILIVIAIVGASLSLIYYLIIYVPQKDKREYAISRENVFKEECKKDYEERIVLWEKFVDTENVAVVGQRLGVGDEDGVPIQTDVFLKKCIADKEQFWSKGN